MKRFLKSIIQVTVTMCCLCSMFSESRVAASAQEICPLLPGTKIPQVSLIRPDGTPFDLLKEVSQKESILIFYRGGW